MNSLTIFALLALATVAFANPRDKLIYSDIFGEGDDMYDCGENPMTIYDSLAAERGVKASPEFIQSIIMEKPQIAGYIKELYQEYMTCRNLADQLRSLQA